MTLILIGYMGSGKSSVGKRLAQILDYEYADLDDYIEEKEHQSISELFSNKGEIYFRKVESKYLADILEKQQSVISLGGGTPCYGQNMKLIRSSKTKSVYLRARVTTLSARIYPEREKRPLVAHLDTQERMLEFVGKHLFERSPFYETADLTVDTDDLTVDQIAEHIVSTLF